MQHNNKIEKNFDFLITDKQYKEFVTSIKDKVRSSRLRAAIAINHEVIRLYWYIGKQIIVKQSKTNWGDKLISALSQDLQNSFPKTAGFSATNLKRMRLFAKLYPTLEIGAQAVPQLPWGQIIVLIHRVKSNAKREWYAQKSILNSWGRSTLEQKIRQNLFNAQAIAQNKVSNFIERLPGPQSRVTQELLKSPYNFDFLGLHDEALEREVEYASIKHITKFMIELGKGFAFVGSQVPISLSDKEYFIDMLFYHLKLHAFCVIELKSSQFKPEHAGKLNFYLNLVDDYYKTTQDNPSFGLLLCKSRNKFEAEYALKGIEKPIGVSEYELTKVIPDNLKNNLPTIEEIEAELSSNIFDTICHP